MNLVKNYVVSSIFSSLFLSYYKLPIPAQMPGVPLTVQTHPFCCPTAGLELKQTDPAVYVFLLTSPPTQCWSRSRFL